MIYVNGDSYMSETGTPPGKTIADHLSAKLNMPAINNAVPGSSNARIIRTSMKDLINFKKEHDNIIACIGLSFIYRHEVWDATTKSLYWKNTNDAEFASYQFANDIGWFEKLKNSDTSFMEKSAFIPPHIKSYGKEWLRLFDAEAEITRLLQQVLMFSAWCTTNNIRHCIFTGPPIEKINDFNAPFIKPFYDEVMNNKNILNLFDFGFTKYCSSKGHIPYDIDKFSSLIGHYDENAHFDFAEFLSERFL